MVLALFDTHRNEAIKDTGKIPQFEQFVHILEYIILVRNMQHWPNDII